MATAAAAREFSARREAERIFLTARARGGRQVRGGDAQEFSGVDFEGEFLVAFTADVGGYFAGYGDDAWEGVDR